MVIILGGGSQVAWLKNTDTNIRWSNIDALQGFNGGISSWCAYRYTDRIFTRYLLEASLSVGLSIDHIDKLNSKLWHDV